MLTISGKHVIWIVCIAVLSVILLFYIQTSKSIEGYQSQQYELPTEILLINLDSRQDRLASFEKNYAASDCVGVLPFTRISATVGKDVKWEGTGLLGPEAEKELQYTLKTGKRKGHDSLPSIGGIGCYLSHLKAMEYVVKNNKPMIICEDDIVLPKNFYEKMKGGILMAPTNPHMNMILLFHVFCSGWDKLNCILKSDNFYEVHKFWSLACYYITPTAAKTILENAKPIDVQIDAKLGQLVEAGKTHIYAYPIAETNGALGTNIQIPLV